MISEYLRCLGSEFDPESLTSTLGDLEKVLFGEETDDKGAARFDVQTRDQGEAAVDAVREACRLGQPYAIVFIDVRMPPGIDGIEAAKQIREIDQNVNIVVVTGSLGPEPDDLGSIIPPADRVFFFKKPFHAIECRQLAAALCGKWHSDLALREANEQLERRVAERTEALHKLAYYDPVTELPNRLRLIEELEVMLIESDDKRREAAVVLLDIERFSFLNETMGYDRGTDLLVNIGRRLDDLLADASFGDRALVGRFGSDEFACLVSGVDGDHELRELTESIKEAVETPFIIDGRDIYLKAAIGVFLVSTTRSRRAHGVFAVPRRRLHRSMRALEGGHYLLSQRNASRSAAQVRHGGRTPPCNRDRRDHLLLPTAAKSTNGASCRR